MIWHFVCCDILLSSMESDFLVSSSSWTVHHFRQCGVAQKRLEEGPTSQILASCYVLL